MWHTARRKAALRRARRPTIKKSRTEIARFVERLLVSGCQSRQATISNLPPESRRKERIFMSTAMFWALLAALKLTVEMGGWEDSRRAG